MKRKPPVLGFVAWSGTGKTTLIAQLLPIFRDHGIRVGVIKHTHHNVEFDTPGKDSHTLRLAGAKQMLVTSASRWALFGDKDEFEDVRDIDAEIGRLKTSELDLIIVESFKRAAIPKIEIHRPSLSKPLLFPEDPNICAVASDAPITDVNVEMPEVLDLNNASQIVDFITANVITAPTLE
ncbi:MAG: molybdopterin-guanine dinucleotide biosynthesis protein B [Pseudomonadota bacterium]